MSDLRLAWRRLARAPGFTATAGLTLALGFGADSALLGVAIGSVTAWGLTGVLRAELYEVTPHDPATYVAAILTLLLVAWAACAAPARRAVRTDPVAALRSE